MGGRVGGPCEYEQRTREALRTKRRPSSPPVWCFVLQVRKRADKAQEAQSEVRPVHLFPASSRFASSSGLEAVVACELPAFRRGGTVGVET